MSNIARLSASNGSMQRTSLRTKVKMTVSSLLSRSSKSFTLTPLVEKSVWLEPESKVSLCPPRGLSRFSGGRGVTPFGKWRTQSVTSFRSMSCFFKGQMSSWKKTLECRLNVF
jgi:hypothetical protein